MATGFAPYLLKSIAEVAKENTPGTKIEPMGYLGFLKAQGSPEVVRLHSEAGHKKTVVVKKKVRPIKADTATSAACDVVATLPYTEDTVTASAFRQYAFHIEDETMAQYEEQASIVKAGGNPSVGLMQEMYDNILVSANAILQGVNDDLLTLGVAALGKHRATGTVATVSVNFPLDTTTNNLSVGMNKILTDYKINGGNGRPQIVGSGLMYNFLMQQASKGLDQRGLDTRVQASGVDFYHDLAAASILGANQIICAQPNSVQLVEYMQYKGFKGGIKPGGSTFGTIMLPMQVGDIVVPVEFDFQLKYNDCAQEFTVDGVAATTLQKGYNLILSKTCGIWTIPSDAYKTGDPLDGNRGTLRYTITNA